MNKLSVIVVRDLLHDFIPNDMVKAFLNQSLDVENYEVVIPLKNNSDLYETIALDLERQGINTRYFYTDNSCRSKLVNLAIDHSEGDIILFLGEDFVPNENLLRIHYEAHTKDTSDNITIFGPTSFPERITQRSAFTKWLDDSGQLTGINFTNEVPTRSFFFYFGNSSLKRSLTERLGPVNEDLPYPCLDDYEYGVRMKKLGIRSRYEPKASAIHDHPLDEKERTLAMYQAGYSSGILNKKLNALLLITRQLVKLVLNYLRTLTLKQENLWRYRLHLSFIKGMLSFYLVKYFRSTDFN
ncbi:glycosyltransferase [Ekhidna sp.]|uniref:glycosyltransferase family 2 protein n=1 Tax=Ekhidna sp. TaxID=2608089 RepID=UPI003298763E